MEEGEFVKVAMFDMDGTLTEEVDFMRKYAPTFLSRKYGLEVQEVNSNAYSLEDVYNLQNVFRDKGYEKEDAKRKAEQVAQEFWNHYFVKYCNKPLKKGVKETVKFFRDRGYAIHIVTMRGKKTKQKEKLKDILIRKIIIPLLTKRQLWKAGIKVDCLEMPLWSNEKIEYISAINPRYYFEDQADFIEKAVECISSKSKVICVNSPYNAKASLTSKVMRIIDFEDKALLEEINRIVYTSSKGTYADKHISNIFYRIVRIIGKPIVLTLYRPIICGKERIPRERSVAFVGNHRTKSDPIIMIAIIKQIIHWAALQRLLNGGEDLFSSSKKHWKCKMSAWFLKAMGVVPIARPEYPDYQNTNLNTIKFLTRQLKEKQSSVGFFPEGTHNREPHKQNILPLKSNRIFRMVSVAETYIQPFSIVWIPKNELIKNRVIVIFSYPINSENRNADELSDMWKRAEERSINECNIFIDSLMKIEGGKEARFQKRKKVKERFRELRGLY